MRFVAGFAAVSVPMLAYVLLRSRAGARPQPGRDDRARHLRPSHRSCRLRQQSVRPVGTGHRRHRVLRHAARRPVTFYRAVLSAVRRVPGVGRLDGALGDAARTGAATAAAGIGATVWKVHATATYIAWFYPFLLLGLLGTPASATASATLPNKR